MPSRLSSHAGRSLIRIAVIADKAARAEALAAVLADDDRLDVVLAASAASDTLTRGELPDVTIALAISASQLRNAGSPLVVISNESAPASMLGENTHAWLPLSSSASEIAAAIFAAACGLFVVSSQQLRRSPPLYEREDDQDAPFETLTARELQVLRMLADGLGNKEIAAQLRVSNHTAKFHVAQILAKLGAVSRTEAVTIGIRRGWVPL